MMVEKKAGGLAKCMEAGWFDRKIPSSGSFRDAYRVCSGLPRSCVFHVCFDGFFSDGLNILRLFDESTYTNKAYSKRGGSRRDKNVPWDKNAP